MAALSFYNGYKGGWVVIHKDHYGNLYPPEGGIYRPMNIDFRLQRNDAHDITYDLAKAEPTMQWGFVGPYRTEWELWRDDFLVASGWHTQVITKKGEEAVHIAGKGYLNYLQVRHYPFNPQDTNAFVGGDIHLSTFQGVSPAYHRTDDVAIVIAEVLQKILDRPNSMNIRIGNPVDGLGITGETHTLEIPLGDTTFVYDYISQLSQLHPGFDFACDIHQAEGGGAPPEFYIMSPYRFGDFGTEKPQPGDCMFIFDDKNHPFDVTDIEFDNSGPAMTHILAMGQGVAGDLGIALSYDQSESIFYRLDGTMNSSLVLTKKHIESLAQSQLSHDLHPQHLIPVQLRPDEIENFWQLCQPGELIWCDFDFGAQHIANAMIINQIHGTINNQGDETIELAVEDIYQLGRPGTVRG